VQCYKSNEYNASKTIDYKKMTVMKTARWFIGSLFMLLTLLVGWQYIAAYRASSTYFCDGPETVQIAHPYIPLIGEFVFVDSLEVYLGGWIERGALTIHGDILDEAMTFTAGERPTKISYARMGEWYSQDFQVVFEPTDMSSCLVRIVYRFRGIF
jgi:hypothetical protein